MVISKLRNEIQKRVSEGKMVNTVVQSIDLVNVRNQLALREGSSREAQSESKKRKWLQ